MSYNNPINISKISQREKYAYIDNFSKSLALILSLPIKDELKRRKCSIMQLQKELTARGYKYNYTSLVNAMQGRNPYVVNLTYFSRIYEHLELPIPTIDYLSSFK